jgi:hypothetical protein
MMIPLVCSAVNGTKVLPTHAGKGVNRRRSIGACPRRRRYSFRFKYFSLRARNSPSRRYTTPQRRSTSEPLSFPRWSRIFLRVREPKNKMHGASASGDSRYSGVYPDCGFRSVPHEFDQSLGGRKWQICGLMIHEPSRAGRDELNPAAVKVRSSSPSSATATSIAQPV